MNDNVSEFPVDPHAMPATMAETRPLYWSVRRELWENKSIWIAPLIIAAVVLFGSFIATVNAPSHNRKLEPAKQQRALLKPMRMAPAPIMLLSFFVGAIYCLDALHGERRDRSILFWKSMPVSDGTTVLAKAAIPFVVIPAIVLALSITVQIILTFVASLVAAGSGMGMAAIADHRFFQGLVIMFYGYYGHVLWFAPLYAWLLLVSSWARRMPILWAVMPPLSIAAIEAMLFGTTSFLQMVKYRFAGAMKEAFAPQARDGNVRYLSDLDPLNFFTRPGLWLGLIAAAAFLYAAARLRRNHQPA